MDSIVDWGTVSKKAWSAWAMHSVLQTKFERCGGSIRGSGQPQEMFDLISCHEAHDPWPSQGSSSQCDDSRAWRIARPILGAVKRRSSNGQLPWLKLLSHHSLLENVGTWALQWGVLVGKISEAVQSAQSLSAPSSTYLSEESSLLWTSLLAGVVVPWPLKNNKLKESTNALQYHVHYIQGLIESCRVWLNVYQMDPRQCVFDGFPKRTCDMLSRTI